MSLFLALGTTGKSLDLPPPHPARYLWTWTRSPLVQTGQSQLSQGTRGAAIPFPLSWPLAGFLLPGPSPDVQEELQPQEKGHRTLWHRAPAEPEQIEHPCNEFRIQFGALRHQLKPHPDTTGSEAPLGCPQLCPHRVTKGDSSPCSAAQPGFIPCAAPPAA